MEYIIYTSIFLIGIVFGSFFTLAVYRIPLKENIVYGRSHCTNCNHKLGFFDLIPIFSYIFLGGKCRYCGQKIRIRYLLLELFSGITFLMIALTYGIEDMLGLCFIYLFIAGMFIIAGIDKEKHEIPNSLCIYGFIIAVINFIYTFFTKRIFIEFIVGAVAIPFVLFLINKLVYSAKKDDNKISIGHGDINYLFIIGLMFGFPVQIISIVLSLIIALIDFFIHKYKEIPWGYYLTISTVIVLIIKPYVTDIIKLLSF